MAHEIRRMKEQEAALGLSEDEIAFYDALTADDIVREFMADDTLKKIAQASMRKIIKRLLKFYKYPPEQADKALKIVMRQAEKMCGNVIVEGFWYDKVAEEQEEQEEQEEYRV